MRQRCGWASRWRPGGIQNPRIPHDEAATDPSGPVAVGYRVRSSRGLRAVVVREYTPLSRFSCSVMRPRVCGPVYMARDREPTAYVQGSDLKAVGPVGVFRFWTPGRRAGALARRFRYL